ncbi:MAG: SurA N-terminal domain-containing protein [Nitrospinae bacterium]|nr:SurA N-terminal domain-containing protein [Nitrospinota bacterium]
MLDIMRKHAQSWIIKLILWTVVAAFVGTIFYGWGMGGRRRSSGGIVAKVYGEDLTYREYQELYNNLYNLYRNIYKERFSDEMAKRMNLKDTVLKNLINAKILMVYAKKEGLIVTDDEVADNIYEKFSIDGRFNRDLYLNFLKSQRISPRGLEDRVREDLLVKKMDNLLRSGVKLSKREIMDAYKRQEEKVKIDYILLSSNLFREKVKASKEDIEGYYNGNKEEFRRPEGIKVEYIFIDQQLYEGEIMLTDEDLKEYYDEHISNYETKDGTKPFDEVKGKIAGILKRKEGMKKAKREIMKIRDEIGSGKGDLREIAERNSVKVETTDFLIKGQGSIKGIGFAPEIASTAFSLADNEISDIVETQQGYLIMRPIERRPSFIPELDTIREEGEMMYIRKKSQEYTEEEAKRLEKEIKGGKRLAEIAEEMGLKIERTDFFKRDDSIPNIGRDKDFANAAFTIDKGEVEMVKRGDRYYLIELVEKMGIDDEKFKEGEKEFVENLLKEKETRVLQAWLDQAKGKGDVWIDEGFSQ